MDFSHIEYVEELKTLAAKVGQVAYGVHEYFGVGLLEKVYETALEHRLVKGGFKVERQKPLNVYDEDGFCVGEYFADLLVDEKLIVELKAAKMLSSEHLAQVLNYMKITRQPVALLVNFGSYKFERRTIVNSTSSPTSSLSPDSPPSTRPNLSSHPQPIPSPSQPPTRSTCSTRQNFLPVSQPQSSTCSTRPNPNHEV